MRLPPGREHDVVGFGMAYTRYSEGSRTFDRDFPVLNPTGVVRTGELVSELLYRTEIAPWWV